MMDNTKQKVIQLLQRIIINIAVKTVKFILKYRTKFNAKYHANITFKQAIQLILKQIVRCIIISVATIIILVAAFNKIVVKDKCSIDNQEISASSESIGEMDGNPEVIEINLNKEMYPISPNVDHMRQAQKLNDDVQAWIEIPNSNINHPIMQTDDNSFYLSHNEKGEYDQWGSYFADYYATIESVEDLTQNTVIYGHTDGEYTDGKKFSELYKYLDMTYLKSNPYIYLTIEEKELPFEIFAVFYSDIDFYYINPTPSDMPFDYFLDEVNKRNEFVFADTEVSEYDKLLTLSGCSYKYDTNNSGNHRFVVMAKLVEDERKNIDIEKNENPLRPKE